MLFTGRFSINMLIFSEKWRDMNEFLSKILYELLSQWFPIGLKLDNEVHY